MKKIKITEKSIRKVIVYVVCFVILTIPFFLYRININTQDKNSNVRWLYQNTNWKLKAKVEGDYTAFMYDVINAFSSRSSHDSMRKEERIKYARLNFKLAQAFGKGYFDVPIIHILESDLNPRKKHTTLISLYMLKHPTMKVNTN